MRYMAINIATWILNNSKSKSESGSFKPILRSVLEIVLKYHEII